MIKNKKSWLIGIILLVSTTMTGCSSDVEKSHTALILGNTSNSPIIDSMKLKETIYDVSYSYGTLSVIIPDGNPFVFDTFEMENPNRSVNEKKRSMDANAISVEISEKLESANAKTEEVDLLKAIQYGVRSLSSAGEGKKNLVIFHSGLSTTGSLDFTAGYLESINVDEVVQKLKDTSEIPSLDNVNVTWYYCGDVQKPQEQLSSENREKLKSLWRAIFTEAGAEVNFKEDTPIDGERETSLPHVEPIKVLTTSSVIDSDDYAYSPSQIVVLEENMIKFKEESSELLNNSEHFFNSTESLITYLKEHKDYKILLCGSTATDGKRENSLQLSKQRAEKVKELLVSKGVNEAQIFTVGTGFDSTEFHYPDLDEDGNLIESIAIKNRVVNIFNYQSKEAQLLIKEYS